MIIIDFLYIKINIVLNKLQSAIMILKGPICFIWRKRFFKLSRTQVF